MSFLFDVDKKKTATKSGPVKLDDAMMERIDRFYQAGIKRLPDAESWYVDTFANIQNIMSYDDSGEKSDELAYLFIDLLAATSPQTNIVRNTFLTSQIFAYINDAILCKTPMKFEAHLNNVCRALLGLPLSGQKVEAFQANLRGDDNAVTVDTWMMRVFNRDSDSPSAKEYEDLSAATRRVAKQYGVKPAQMQAALWVGIKALEGDPSDTPEPFEKTLDRFKARQDAQGALDFDKAESKFKNAEEQLAERPVASNPPEPRYSSARVIGPRMKEIGMREGDLDPLLIDTICAQPSALLMAAILRTRKNVDRWTGDPDAADKLIAYLEKVFSDDE